MKDLETVALEAGISLIDLKDALGIPLSVSCNTTNADEAREILLAAHWDSEEERAARTRWHKLLQRDINEAKTVEEAKMAFHQIPQEMKKLTEAAINKWDECSIKEVEAAETVESVIDASVRAPIYGRARKVAHRKWVSLCSSLDGLKNAIVMRGESDDEGHAAMRKFYDLFPETEAVED